jgi:pimeloyl-ACP methyl ester carboxylesterase
MMRHITSDGVALRVIESGERHASVTVMLLHGWTQSARTWDWTAHVLPQWADIPVRTVRYDLRGHGGPIRLRRARQPSNAARTTSQS